MGGGWNWLRIVCSGGFVISGVEPSGSATRELVNSCEIFSQSKDVSTSSLSQCTDAIFSLLVATYSS